MNKIIIGSNITSSYSDDLVVVSGNTITFKVNGHYEVEMDDVNCLNIKFVINNCSVDLIISSFSKKIEINTTYEVNGGKLNVNKFYDNEYVREKIDINLLKTGDIINYNFADICRVEEYYEININHKNIKTISNIINKSVSLKNSVLNFIINSNVDKIGIDSVLNQETRIVTIGDSDCKICPNMYIDIDQVSAKHGSVIGTFSDDQLFYLMSKGISYNDSLSLLIKGYLLSDISVSLDIRRKIIDIIEMYWR